MLLLLLTVIPGILHRHQYVSKYVMEDTSVGLWNIEINHDCDISVAFLQFVLISSPSGSPKTLVFRRQISSPNSKGFPRTWASNKGRSEKFSDFLHLSFNISKTVADTANVTISH